MGSIDKACISGFLCRLCSEMHRTVIHIYGDQGHRLGLVEKINGYLPITISPTDPLPKTICQSCLLRVEQHYDLLLRLSRIKEGRYLRIYKPRTSPCSSHRNTDDEVVVETLSRNNSNGPFIIASTSSRSALPQAHAQWQSPSPSPSQETSESQLPPIDGNDDDDEEEEVVGAENDVATQTTQDEATFNSGTSTTTTNNSTTTTTSTTPEHEEVIEDGIVDMDDVIND